MKVRLVGFVGFMLIALGCTSQVSAEWFFGIFNSAARETKRRQCWPEPFTGPDRAAVRSPFAAMVQNGWERQNLLGEYHFDKDGRLNEAGKNKVRWIFLSAPQQHRVAYVHTGMTQAETNARVAAVQELVSNIAPTEAGAIHVSSISEEGWPAEEVNRINRKFMESTPKPRLPPMAAPGSASTGGPSV